MEINTRYMKINTRYIKITGRDEVSKEYQMGEDVLIEAQGEVVKIDYKNNQDGTVDVVYHIKLFCV